MRAELADTALARRAGRFVWLDLNFDSRANHDFLVQHAIVATPTLLVLDPSDGRATATHLGGLTLPELNRFLDQGAHGVEARTTTPVDAAMARGDAELGLGHLSNAIASYREALRAGGPAWPDRARALAQLTMALATNRDRHGCATLAAAEAPHMQRSTEFAHVVAPGLENAVAGGSAPWAGSARTTLVPLAVEALSLTGIDRDTRFQLYRGLVTEAKLRGNDTTAARWGLRWQHELDAIVPRNVDERTGLDIARVEAAEFVPDPEHFIPALEASERAMPGNYVASLRLAQLLLSVGRRDQAIAACDRGLPHVDGPLGRTWLLELKGQALIDKGDHAGARHALAEARRSAVQINMPNSRENNLRKIGSLMEQAGGAAR